MIVAPTGPLSLVASLLSVLSLLIIVEVLVSWAIVLRIGGVSSYAPWVRTLRRLVDPILEPIRRLVPPERMGGLDISPLIAIMLIQFLQQLLYRAG